MARVTIGRRNACEIACCLGLPDSGQKAVADSLSVFGVAGQFGQEGAFLEADSDDEHGDGGEGRDEAPGGADDQRGGEGPKARAEIAGVADEGIRPGCHDLVAAVRLDADGCFEMRVGQHGPGQHGGADKVHERAGDGGPEAQVRPTVSAHVQADDDGKDVEPDQAVDRHEGFVPGLGVLFLFPLPAMVDQLGVGNRHGDDPAEDADEAQAQEQPRPRQVEPTRRGEQQSALDDRREEAPCDDYHPRLAQPVNPSISV
jgi:hypothetical protein